MEKKINGAAGEKKIGYGVKMLVYNHTVTQQTLFCGAKKENGAAGKKKIRGTVPLQAERAKILRFHHSSHLGDLGVGRGAPKSAQKCPLFFFFFFPQKSRIMRCRIIRYMELFPCFFPQQQSPLPSPFFLQNYQGWGDVFAFLRAVFICSFGFQM